MPKGTVIFPLLTQEREGIQWNFKPETTQCQKKPQKKPLKKITTLESTSRDNANAKSLAQFKGGLDIYTDNGNNGSEKMILKAI